MHLFVWIIIMTKKLILTVWRVPDQRSIGWLHIYRIWLSELTSFYWFNESDILLQRIFGEVCVNLYKYNIQKNLEIYPLSTHKNFSLGLTKLNEHECRILKLQFYVLTWSVRNLTNFYFVIKLKYKY